MLKTKGRVLKWVFSSLNPFIMGVSLWSFYLYVPYLKKNKNMEIRM